MASCSEKIEGVRGAREAIEPATLLGVPFIGLAGELNMVPVSSGRGW